MKRKFRIAVIGAGMIANAAHIPAIMEHVKNNEAELVGVADPREEIARETALRNGIPNAFADPEEMMEKTAPDLVVICTPNAYHKHWTLRAAAHGASILCEKPIAVCAEDAKEMYAATKAVGVMLFSGQCMRWRNEIQVGRELISAGEIGTPYFADISSIRRYGVPSWGMFHMRQHNFGGPFCDIGVHLIDSLLWMTGNPKFVSASATNYSRVVKNSGEVLTSLAESGAPAGVFTPRKYDPSEFSVEEFSVGRLLFENEFSVNLKIAWAVFLPSTDMQIDIVGDKGGLSTEKHMLYKNIGRYQSEIALKEYENRIGVDRAFSLHYYMYDDVFKTLHEGIPFRVTEQETINMADIISCFYESARTGREVRSKV